MKRTTLNEIKQFVTMEIAENITSYGFDKINRLAESENGFDKIFYSTGIYGINGALLQGRKTGNYYAIVARTSALFQLV